MEDEIMEYEQDQIEVLREQRQQQVALQRSEVKVDVVDKGMDL